MANEKISAMPAATEVVDTDLVPIVQAGINKKATRQMLLTGSNNAPILLRGSSGQFAGIQAGIFSIQIRDDGFLSITFPGGTIQSDSAGNLILHGSTVAILSISGAVTIGQDIGGSVSVMYNPSDLGNWQATPPDQAAAINRIAAVVAALLGGPIP